MTIKKGQAYTLGITAIIGLYSSAVIGGAHIADIYGPTLTAIVTLTIGFIGGNVADNGVKGRFYNSALDK